MRRFSPMIVLAGLLVAAPLLGQPNQARPSRPSVPQLVAVIPVAISSPGRFGSLFKTELQVHNADFNPFTFRAVFHPAGTPGQTTDPFLDISIPSFSTVHIPDLLPAMGQSGIGSLDILALSTPGKGAAVIRVFNDAGAAGTSGFSEPFLDVTEYLYPAASAILICPADPSLQRFNVGVRTMDQGATIQVTARDGSGHDLANFTRSYPPVYFEQTDVAAFLGNVSPPGNSTIAVQTISGGLYLYGVSADNVTNDPSMQVPTRFEPY